MFEILGLILFWLILIIGVAVIPFGVAGTFIIVMDALIYAIFTGFEKITWLFLLGLLGLAILVEVVEFFMSAIAARKYGATKWGMWGSIIGSLIGAILGTPVFPVVGTLIGSFIGAFVGAVVFELMGSQDVDRSFRAGYGAFLGAVGGKVTKIAAAVAMVILIGVRIW